MMVLKKQCAGIYQRKRLRLSLKPLKSILIRQIIGLHTVFRGRRFHARGITFAINEPFFQLFSALTDYLYAQELSKINAPNPQPMKWLGLESKIILGIGTLGPGGAERQFVFTSNGLWDLGYQNQQIICMSLANEVDRFYLSNLKNTDVKTISEIQNQSPFSIENNSSENLVEKIPGLDADVSEYLALFQSERPDIVHLWLDECNVKGGIAATLAGVPRIILGMRSLPPTNFQFYQPYMRSAYQWLARLPSVIMVNNSSAGARAYEEWLGLKHGDIKVISNGIGHSQEQIIAAVSDGVVINRELKTNENEKIIGVVMRFSHEKDPIKWIEVANRVISKGFNAKFVIIGDGPMRPLLERMVDTFRLREKILFLGVQKNALQYIASFDLYLSLSRVEGLPNVLLEAQALGIPVLTTDAGGSSEVILADKTGWIINLNDKVEEIAEKLIVLLSSTDKLNSARAAAPNFVLSHFSMSKMISKTKDIYFDCKA